MASEREILESMTRRALAGEGSHVTAEAVFTGLDWKLAGARIGGAAHTLFQLLNHITYWQEWAVKWLDGGKPRPPKHAAGGWPGGAGPANRREWERTAKRFNQALDALHRRSQEKDPLLKRGKMTRLEMLHLIAAHNSYHAGQVAFLRQMLAAWPPPSGGVTW